jgi:3-methyladenine DNA glycosylase AlkD
MALMNKPHSILRPLANPSRARELSVFFKTGPGEYAAHDRFLGIAVPEIRKHVPLCDDMGERELGRLLESPYNEERLLALLSLVRRFGQPWVPGFYLRHLHGVNNWNLVDSSAWQILGRDLIGKNRKIIYKLAKSEVMWERRVAIVSTFAFIRENDLSDTFDLSVKLMTDKEDLIHKACGWMLREAGKRDAAALRAFLHTHRPNLPRTTLRYAIEKFDAGERRGWLA